MEENKSVRVIESDKTLKGQFVHTQTLELSAESKSIFSVTEYEHAIISEHGVYKSDSYFILVPS